MGLFYLIEWRETWAWLLFFTRGARRQQNPGDEIYAGARIDLLFRSIHYYSSYANMFSLLMSICRIACDEMNKFLGCWDATINKCIKNVKNYGHYLSLCALKLQYCNSIIFPSPKTTPLLNLEKKKCWNHLHDKSRKFIKIGIW